MKRIEQLRNKAYKMPTAIEILAIYGLILVLFYLIFNV